MKAFVLTFFIIIITSCASNPPVNSAETIDAGNQGGGSMENTIKIRGQIQIYGNEPHTFVGIAAEDGTEYAVFPPAKEDELRTLQGHLIEFTVVLLDEPQGFGGLYLKGGTVTPIEWKIQ